MGGMPSAQNTHHNDFGGMPSSCFTAVAPMKCCVTIWEEFIVKNSYEIPMTNYQYPNNHQWPNSNHQIIINGPNTKSKFWLLEIGIYLIIGAWCLVIH